jgi:hypothetical protein
MPADRKWLFLDEVFLSNAIGAALGHSGTYKKEGGPKDKSEILGRALIAQLRKLAAAYSVPVDEEEHINNIRALAKNISAGCAECLKGGGLRFGVAHKALNVYLKFLWCEGRITMPPHCPFDDGMIKKLNKHLPRGCGRQWTRGTEGDYRAWVTAAKVLAGTKPLAEWELELYTPEKAINPAVGPATGDQMNPYVSRIVSLLKSVRGLVATPFTTEGTDRRVYVQIVGVPGFPVFAVKPSGAYELPFEHTYTNAEMKKKGWPILSAESEGLNGVLFADKLAARPRNRHDLCQGYDYDTAAIARVRKMAAEAAPQESWQIWQGAA